MPKNMDNLNLGLAATSAVGGLLLAYAYTGGRLASAGLPINLVTFAVITGGLYGAGFLIVPKILIDMNFTAPVDRYHEFLARFSGLQMVLITYALYSGWFADGFSMACLWMSTIAFIGPTQAALYLEPKQTPMGHMPAHVLFLIAGIIAVTTP